MKLQNLDQITAEEWAELDHWSADPEWDIAWEQVLEAGGETSALSAMRRARTLGAPLGAAALAAAAVAAECLAAPASRAVLERPFAGLRRWAAWQPSGQEGAAVA
ncbi:MAG TPA: hypothetical protein VF134_04800 [Candidatus Dormibacteraeota bacterium]